MKRGWMFFLFAAMTGWCGNLYYYNHGEKIFLTPQKGVAARSVDGGQRFRTDRGQEVTIGKRLFVKLKKGVEIDPLLRRYGLKLIKKMNIGDLYLLEADSTQGAIESADALHELPEVIFAQPDIAKKRQLR